jgi:ferredoxin-NADP reductase
MANEVNLNLDPRGFLEILPQRAAAFEAASKAPLPADYPVNKLMRALHPDWQHTRIQKIEAHGAGAKSFTLVPDESKGTNALAYFSAGQYVCVYLAIGASRLLRPYSLRSAPSDASEGKYVLTIKRAQDGFASDYILNDWKEGDAVTLTGPEGNFTYEPLRDAREIVGIAGGSGVTPFFSLARAIAGGAEDCRLTLLYGSRRERDILLKDEFDALARETDKVKVIYVLSDDPAEGYESGFITADLIRKYAPAGDYSLFLCGPQEMYAYCDAQIATLALPPRRVRHELFGAPAAQPNHPQGKGGVFTMKVITRDSANELPCAAAESLLTALERAGVVAPSRCRSGECGFCHAKLLSGEVFVPAGFDKRRLADVTYNYIHPCVTFPLGDVTMEVPGQKAPV